jgi:hypothetical protein
MTVKRAFISFDFDHDDDLRNALVGQAKYPNSPFEIVDASVRRHLPGDWERQVRRRIGRADLVIVMCGQYTHEAEGVAIEVKIAQEEGVEYFLLRGHSDRVCTKPATSRSDDELHEWTWDNLRLNYPQTCATFYRGPVFALWRPGPRPSETPAGLNRTWRRGEPGAGA